MSYSFVTLLLYLEAVPSCCHLLHHKPKTIIYFHMYSVIKMFVSVVFLFLVSNLTVVDWQTEKKAKQNNIKCAVLCLSGQTNSCETLTDRILMI